MVRKSVDRYYDYCNRKAWALMRVTYGSSNTAIKLYSEMQLES